MRDLTSATIIIDFPITIIINIIAADFHTRVEADRASGYYEIGNPLFLKVTVKLDEENPGTFIIKANNVSGKDMYI